MAGLEGIFGGVNWGGMMSTTGSVAKFILVGVILGLIGWMLWYYLSFNIKVGINEKNGNEGYITKWDKGRFKKNKKTGLLDFQILKDKRWKQPLDRKYLAVEKKMFGRISKLVMFAEDEESRLQPIRPVTVKDISEWTGWDNDDVEFSASNARAVIEMAKKPDFMSKYGALLQIAAMALIFVMAIILFRQINGVSESLALVAGSFERAANSFATVMITNGTQVIQ